MSTTIFTAGPVPKFASMCIFTANIECWPLIWLAIYPIASINCHYRRIRRTCSTSTPSRNTLRVCPTTKAFAKWLMAILPIVTTIPWVIGYFCHICHWPFLLLNSPNVKHAHYSQFASIWMATENGAQSAGDELHQRVQVPGWNVGSLGHLLPLHARTPHDGNSVKCHQWNDQQKFL